MKTQLKDFYNKFKDRIVITLGILLILSLTSLFLLLRVDDKLQRIDTLQVENEILKETIKEKESQLIETNDIIAKYERDYVQPLKEIKESQNRFNQFKNKQNEKIKTIRFATDAELEQFFIDRAKR